VRKVVSGCANITIDQQNQSSMGGSGLVGVGVGVWLKKREGWESVVWNSVQGWRVGYLQGWPVGARQAE
jgi:hypothetical protein